MKPITVNGKKIKFELVKNKPMISSLDIAKHFEKLHKRLLQTIKENEAYEEFINGHEIVPVKYKDAKDEERPMFLLGRDAFSFFVMGFTGKKAKQWKLNYIKAFNLMEEQLRKNMITFEEVKQFLPKGGFMQENKKGQIKTKPVRGYYRADTKSELGQLIQKRYELQKRLNGLMQEEMKLELTKVNNQIAVLSGGGSVIIEEEE